MTAPPDDPHTSRSFPGTQFVILVVLAMALFVTFLVVGSPVLLERTLERVPPAAPHTVAEAADWEAVATQADEDTACIDLTVGGETTQDCTGVRGGSIRILDARPAPAGGWVAYGIVDARTTEVAIAIAEGGPLGIEVVHVDFGFPLGFFATELRPGVAVEGVVARDRDGDPRAEARCSGEPTAGACRITDVD